MRIIMIFRFMPIYYLRGMSELCLSKKKMFFKQESLRRKFMREMLMIVLEGSPTFSVIDANQRNIDWM
jgi:hypothetical protein